MTISLRFAETYDESELAYLEDFQFLNVLGQGAFGKVILARKLTGPDAERVYAMKIVQKRPLLRSCSSIRLAKHERLIMERVSGRPFLMDMYYAFQSPTKLYLVIKFAQAGDLLMLLRTLRRMDVDTCRFYLTEIVLAVEQLHAVSPSTSRAS